MQFIKLKESETLTRLEKVETYVAKMFLFCFFVIVITMIFGSLIKYSEKNSILIDDRIKAIDPWIKANGIGILHKDALSTIQQLKSLGIE